jgi:hypothetical protein
VVGACVEQLGGNIVQREVQKQEVCSTVLSEVDSVPSGDIFPSCTEGGLS